MKGCLKTLDKMYQEELVLGLTVIAIGSASTGVIGLVAVALASAFVAQVTKTGRVLIPASNSGFLKRTRHFRSHDGQNVLKSVRESEIIQQWIWKICIK